MIFSSIKSYKHLLALAAGFIVTIIAIIIFAQSSYFPLFEAWIKQNIFLYSFALVVIKITGTVWPPIPGGTINIASIPLLGWSLAFLVDLIGGVIGGSLAYLFGRKWGSRLLNKIFDTKTLDFLNKIRVPEEKQFEAILVFHTLGPVIELVAYGSGFLRVRYKNYLLGWLASHTILALPLFYLAEGIFSKSFLYHGTILLVGIILLFVLRKRYFKVI